MLERKTICILGSYGEGNIGDEAILDGIILQIKKKYSSPQIVVFSHNPKETESQHEGVIAYPVLPAGIRSSLKQLVTRELQRSFYALKAASDIIIGGGGIFYDHGFSTGKNPIEVWHTRCNTILRLKKSYRIYGVGVSHLKKSTSKLWLKQICDNASAVAVRDESSKQVLKEIGVNKTVAIVDDPALSLMAPQHVHAHKSQPVIGISIRQWFLDDTGKQSALQKKLVELIGTLEKQLHAQIVLIPFSVGKDDDRVVMKEIVVACKAAPDCHPELVEGPHTVRSRLTEIASLDLLIGMRLHSIIFAHLTKTPWIALGYADKVKSIAGKLGTENRYFDIENLSVEKVVAAAEQLQE